MFSHLIDILSFVTRNLAVKSFREMSALGGSMASSDRVRAAKRFCTDKGTKSKFYILQNTAHTEPYLTGASIPSQLFVSRRNRVSILL